jgi:hypothetical protein
LKRPLIAAAALLCISLSLVSCSSTVNTGTTSSSTGGTSAKPSGLAVRAFVSNPLQPSGVSGAFNPVLNIVDASLDQVSFSAVNLLGSIRDPGLMALSPNKQRLLVFSAADKTVLVVDTIHEAVASTSTAAIPIPGATQSMFIASDNNTGYVAVPTATVTGAPVPGAVEVVNLAGNQIAATIPVPAVRYMVGSHNGNRVLAFGENTCNDGSNSITVIAPSLIGTSTDPRTVVCGFDHPVWGVFSSDDTTAYILNCGPECGGTTAGVTVLDLITNTVGATVPLSGEGATIGLLSGNTLYVAGTPPGTICDSGTLAATCGTLSLIDVRSMTVVNPTPILITDGYHDRMEISGNGQLFVGAKTCTNINTSSEVRGCLSIFDTNKSAVTIPPDNGDVTGIQPITNRNVVYLCQGGNFRIYDTTTDKLIVLPPRRINLQIIGQAVDVKLVD